MAETKLNSSENRAKFCTVCGDKALGHNFNAVTCESCKAFFRRNALKEKDFKCPFSNNCEVTVVTRRFCQKCRLKKCFDIGMKKEFILSDEEKLQKKQKIEENRVKRHRNCTASPSPATTPSPTPKFHQSEYELATKVDEFASAKRDFIKVPRMSDDATFGVMEPMAFSSGGHHNSYSIDEVACAHPTSPTNHQDSPHGHNFVSSTVMTADALSSTTTSSTSQQHVFSHQQASLDGHNWADWNFDNLDDVISVAIKAEFHTVDLAEFADAGGDGSVVKSETSPRPSTSSSRNTSTSPINNTVVKLNDNEKARIDELFVASRSLVEPVELEREQYSQTEPNNLISVINLTDIAIKRIIRMAKKIKPFIDMCQEDQVALLKGGCTELMILRSVFNYDSVKNSWRIPSKDRQRELRMEVLKEASELGVNLYEEHQRFVTSFDPRWRTDENVMLLLSAIALFTPERANVVHKDVVKLEQDTYYYLLRRYLESVCSRGCEPRAAYLNLIGKLHDLHRLNESHIQVFLEVNPKQVEPLLIEIFDLNPSCDR